MDFGKEGTSMNLVDANIVVVVGTVETNVSQKPTFNMEPNEKI